MTAHLKLNLGCGRKPFPGFVNVDRVAMTGVDRVADLDSGPWPFPNRCASRIEAHHVFEHVDNPILFMTECHRILTRGGYLHITTPYYRHPDSFTDPTHRRHCTEHTFDYWIPGNPYHRESNEAYGGISFERAQMQITGAVLDVLLRKAGPDAADRERRKTT